MTQFSQAFGAVFSQAAVAGMGLFGSLMVIEGRIGVAELAACMLLNGRTVQPMLKMLGFWVQAETIETARRKLVDLFVVPTVPSAEAPDDLRGEIAIDGLSLERPDGRRYFAGIAAHVAPGRCLGITGPDGAGKAAILHALLGEVAPAAGRLSIDGRAPEDLSGLRGHHGIVYLDRDPVVFDGSLLENIALFGDGEAAARAIEASRRIGLEDEIHRLPRGYDTPLGAGSATVLPRGVLQRICAARALALKPRILLFNEANTALDHEADRRLLEALQTLKGQTTLVLVSRRPSWLALADTLIDLGEAGSQPDAAGEWDEDRRRDAAEQTRQIA